MFEKEAIEKANEKYPLPQVWNEIHYVTNKKYAEGFQDGAEFGYNKANEWHKVLDGDFPKHSNEVLCLLWGGTKEVGYYKNEVWYFEDFTADNEDVDYWQEIIPPKESK